MHLDRGALQGVAGPALPLGEALALEAQRSRKANAAVQPEDIARVQHRLFARGRTYG